MYSICNLKSKCQWYVVLIILIIPSILTVQHEDLFMLTEHANSLYRMLKEGTLFRFYENTYNYSVAGEYITNVGVRGGALYNIVVYIIVAIWLLPIKVIELLSGKTYELGILTLWNKGLLIFAAIALAESIKQISRSFKLNREKEAFWFCLCSPMLLFASLMFGQVDILAVLVAISAMKYYLKNRYWLFSVIMSVAFCVKGFVVFMYIPLLFLAEKNIKRLILHSFLFLGCYIFSFLCFMNTESYYMIVRGMNDIFNYSDRLFSSVILLGKGELYLFPAFFIALCIVSYVTRVSNDNLKKYAVVLPLLVYSAFIIFVDWHPQWVIFIVPFWALAINFVNDLISFCFVDILLEFSFIVTCCVQFRYNVDDAMINNGILGVLFSKTYKGGYLGRLYDCFGMPQTLPYTILVASIMCLIFIVIYSRHKDIEPANLTYTVHWFNRVRYSIILLFLSASIFLWYMKAV